MTPRRPVVITSAERSQDEQLRLRQIRYASMMGLRIACLIAAGVLVSVQAPMLWLWLPLCVVGMVLLPWMAVLVANDRLPKEQYRLGAVMKGGSRRPDPERELQSPTREPERPAVRSADPPVVDAES